MLWPKISGPLESYDPFGFLYICFSFLSSNKDTPSLLLSAVYVPSYSGSSLKSEAGFQHRNLHLLGNEAEIPSPPFLLQELNEERKKTTRFLFLPLIQEGRLLVTGESKCMKYWLTA